MLILTRRVSEIITIGDELAVMILGIKGSQVRIGVHAPSHVAVHRLEIYERLMAEEGKVNSFANLRNYRINENPT